MTTDLESTILGFKIVHKQKYGVQDISDKPGHTQDNSVI